VFGAGALLVRRRPSLRWAGDRVGRIGYNRGMSRTKTRPKTQPAILLVSDLPTWGRVALASAGPLVEASGFQACCLPTALLSTHGAYPGFVLKPQTEFLVATWAHLKTLDVKFAAVALGFVGHRDQFPILEDIVATVKASGGIVLVDPILGDNGRRYGLFGEDYVPAFRSLLKHADVATPNLTEAALLLGEDPTAPPTTDADVGDWVRRLAALGPRRVVLTSAPFEGRNEVTGVAWHDQATGRSGTVAHRRFGKGIPGTGDALAARLVSFLASGVPFPRAVERAVKGTLADLKRSLAAGRPTLWGPEGPLQP
jgi:pyridoxine kinase